MTKLNESAFSRIFATHYIAIVALIGNALFFTEDLAAIIVQYGLAIVVFLHNLDDKYVVKMAIDYYEELRHKITFDELTGVYSRYMIQGNFFKTHPFGIVMVDIDKFSKINDVYGAEFGNLVLKRVAKTLLSGFEKCKVFRFNGDVFVVFIEKKMKKDEILEHIKCVTEQINKPSLIADNQEFFIDLTYGIAMDKYNSIENAEIALNNAKKLNKFYAIYQVEDKDMEKSKQFFYYKNKIKWAIENDKIVLLYQPIVDKNLKIIKYETLVRINDNGNLISPYFFLDIAIQTKQYDKLSEIIFTKAINMATKIDKKLSINFSYRDITNRELLDKFERMVLANKVAHKLVLEILESEEVKDYNEIIKFINKFKKLGCKVAIDDYGSGYSSFEYVLKMDLDYIKIDASLIKNIEEEKSKIVVKNIIDLAKKLKLKTIAEYVENETILHVCQELGVDEYQGYYFSPPKELNV